MSPSSKEDMDPSANERDEAARQMQTLQIDPSLLGRAVNTHPGNDMLRQLDAASAMLDHVEQEGEVVPAETLADDSAIQEYMAALIARTRGQQQTVDSPQQRVQRQLDAGTSSEQVAETGGPEPSAAEPEDSQPWEHVAAPECPDAISDLRELANICARSAVNVHQGCQLVDAMHNKFAVALVASVVSFALIGLARDPQSLTYLAAIVALLVAFSWTLRFIHLGRQLRSLCCANDSQEEAPS